MGIDYLIFGTVDSRDYGIEVFFKDVDRTPKRVYKSIDVPGRNGAVLIDENRYEDVPVAYDCIALLDADRQAFVNALAAQIGYKRMQDSFNGDEFYSAVFDGDVDPNITKDRAQSTFSIYFTRTPQRYLISGETKMTLESGDVLINPTLFESSPVLEAEGYGDIGIGIETVTIQNAQLGEIQISSAASTASVTLDTTNLNTGDSITNKSTTQPYVDITLKTSTPSISYYNASMQNDYSRAHGSVVVSGISANSFKVRVIPKISGFVKGTDFSMTINCFIAIQPQPNGTSYSSVADVTVAYVASTDTVSLSVSFSAGPSPSGTTANYQYMHPAYYGNSSKNILPSPMYIDLDIGEAYGVVNDEIISFNNVVQMPAELPKLKAGDNTITYDNTITDLKVIPRWWEL